jgi:ribose transport system substrate-binding protein
MKELRRRPLRLASVGLLGLALLSGATALSAAASAAPKKTLGVVIYASTDPFSRDVGTGAAAVAKAAGWQVDTLDAMNDLPTMTSDIEALVSRKVTAIVVTTVPSTTIVGALAQAKAANIPVISEDGGLAPGIAAAEANVNPQSSGALIRYMFGNMHGTGSLLALTYTPGAPCLQRDNQLFAGLKKYPKIHMTRYELPGTDVPQAGQTAATAFLESHHAGSGNIAVWGCYDDPSIGALAAAKAMSRTDVQFYGYNGSPAALQAIKTKTFTATVYFDPVAVGHTVFSLVQKVLKAGRSWKPQSVSGPYILVTQKNITSFLAAHPGALSS